MLLYERLPLTGCKFCSFGIKYFLVFFGDRLVKTYILKRCCGSGSKQIFYFISNYYILLTIADSFSTVALVSRSILLALGVYP
jgi:hypothetical protein